MVKKNKSKKRAKEIVEKKKEYPFVRIDWVDICSDSGWASVAELVLEEPSNCVSYGWLLFKNKEKIIISSSTDNEGDGDYGERTTFPACVVQKISPTSIKSRKSIED